MIQIRILHGEIIICRYCLLIHKVITLQLKKNNINIKKNGRNEKEKIHRFCPYGSSYFRL